VFTKFENFGGWPSMGAAVLLGQLASASAFVGVDSAAHMAEEVFISFYLYNIGVPALTQI
jgi:choline transport protein